MNHVVCDLCGADDADVFASRPPRSDVLHARFVRCRSCGAIYADPRATVEEARRHYSAVDSRGAAVRGADLASAVWASAIRDRAPHLDLAARFLTPSESPVRFLDIGFGDASSLAAATARGWEPHGLEYSDWLVDHARERLHFENVHTGGLADVEYADGFFDIVYSWHVIEHVLDVNAWLGEIRRILRPGGVLVVGTENASSLYGKLWTGSFRALRRKPWPPTSTDHTYWFSPESLQAALANNGFEALELHPYENPPLSIIRSVSWSFRNPRLLVANIAYAASAAVSAVVPSVGGKLLAVSSRAG